MSTAKKIAFSEIVEDNIEALSFAKAAALGFSAADLHAGVMQEVDANRCELIGKSDTHIIVAWDYNAPFVITVVDYDKYVSTDATLTKDQEVAP